MVIPFKTMKAVQAAAVLLKEEAGPMSRLRLLKLLYIADRERIAETYKFPEWIKNQPPEGSSKPISLHDVLCALKMEQYEQKLTEEMQADAAMAEALAR